MKAEMIKSASNVITNTIKASAKADTSVATKAVKNGEKMIALAQDAKAAQGKAMIKKAYVKPEVEVVEIEKANLKAASGWDNGGYNPRGGYEAPERRGSWGNIWGEEATTSKGMWD